MTTPMTKEALAQLRLKAERATQGDWWSDVVETDGEYGEGEDRVSGYHSYAVYVGHDSLLDMTNSTAACITVEDDGDYLMAWDEVGQRNAEFIAAANPATVLALLDALEAKDAIISDQDREIDSLSAIAGNNAAQVKELRSRAESAEQALLQERQKISSCPVEFRWPAHGIDAIGGTYHRRTDILESLAETGVTLQIQGGE